MLLCLDVGNTKILGGVFDLGDPKGKVLLRFRLATDPESTADQIGLFLKNILRENQLDPQLIQKIMISSVVPSIDYSLTHACRKYFSIDPFFVHPEMKMVLNIKIDYPRELGGDLISCALAGIRRYPNQNLIIVSFGTATTISAINRHKDYLGVTILPGLRLSMKALSSQTAKLSPVAIVKPDTVLGKNTITSIQAGLYYGQLGAVNYFVDQIKREDFNGEEAFVLGTGGFSTLFQQEPIFNEIDCDLVLHGLRYVALSNI